MNRTVWSAAIGAGLMYFWDPRSGRRRRARAREAFVHEVRQSLRGVDAGSHDLSNRARGALAFVRGAAQPPPDDVVLTERVRARLGHVCSHPHAIRIEAQSGHVVVSGAVLESEATRVLVALRAVPGVISVDDRLERHASPDVPALQGGASRSPARRGGPLATRPLSSGARLALGGTGSAMVAYALLRRGIFATAAGAIGGLALARSMSDAELGAMFGFGTHGREISITKTITIRAPLSDVFAAFADFESFPTFMRRVQAVTRLDEHRLHFSVVGPAGVPFDWDGIVLELVPNEVVSWTSTESASIRHTGSAHFERVPNGTRVTLRLVYEPPLGRVGNALAMLVGADPKHEIDEDMMRFKTRLERSARSSATAAPADTEAWPVI